MSILFRRPWIARTAAAALGGLALPLGASAQYSVVYSFDSGPGGLGSVTTPAGGSAIVLSSGGNPGGFARLQATIAPGPAGTPRTGIAGFAGTGLFPSVFAPGITHVVISADARFDNASTPPIPEVIPIFLQGLFIYAPAAGAAFSGFTWSASGPSAYAVTDLLSSAGAFNPALPFRIGFGVRIRSDLAGGFSGTYGLDNVSIQIVPSPAPAALALLALIPASRRRRR